MTDHSNGIEQARAQRERAEQEYTDAVAQRPETIAVVAKAVQLRNQNKYAESLMLAMRALRRSA